MVRCRFAGLLLALLLPLAAEAYGTEDSRASRRGSPATKARNPHKAAILKRKELRDMGVRNVRVATPGDWPTRVPVPKETALQTVPPQPGVKENLYMTNNYVFLSPVKLDENAQNTIGRLFECAFAANRAIAEVLPVPRTSEDRTEKKFIVRLAPTKEQYRALGGPERSSGVFRFQITRPFNSGPLEEKEIVADEVFVPHESLGLDRHGKVLHNDIDTHTLVHELTHQCFARNGLPIWAYEGWAEYVGYVPYVGEDLDFNRCFSLILHHARKQADNGALTFSFSLEDFFSMSQEEMYGYMEQRQDTYMLATMAVAFFVHLDGKKGVNAMKAYMQALLEGESPAEAARELIKPHRSAKQLQKDFIRAWKRKKVEVNFVEPRS